LNSLKKLKSGSAINQAPSRTLAALRRQFRNYCTDARLPENARIVQDGG
jgi:hypothetical protein